MSALAMNHFSLIREVRHAYNRCIVLVLQSTLKQSGVAGRIVYVLLADLTGNSTLVHRMPR
jgi:hypothetical protein